jgi:HSP20 family protein
MEIETMLVRQPYFTTRRFVRQEPDAERVYRLPIDAYETVDSVVLTASVAGLNTDDLDITLEDGVLIIRGEVNALEEEVNYLMRERFYGKFERRLHINIPVNIESAQATYENGVLRLVLPKAEAVKPHRIAVNAVH